MPKFGTCRRDCRKAKEKRHIYARTYIRNMNVGSKRKLRQMPVLTYDKPKRKL